VENLHFRTLSGRRFTLPWTSFRKIRINVIYMNIIISSNLSSVHASLAEIEEDVKFAEAVNG